MAEKYEDMRSVSFTPSQGNVLDTLAKKEGRKVGNLIRHIVCQYLEGIGLLAGYSDSEEAADID